MLQEFKFQVDMSKDKNVSLEKVWGGINRVKQTKRRMGGTGWTLRQTDDDLRRTQLKHPLTAQNKILKPNLGE